MNTLTISYKHHRFPPQIIAHAVWLYFRFPLSLRLVEEMLLERGIVVSYERIKRWGRKFGVAYTKRLRRKKPSGKDVWHLDEVVISIGGRKHWLWRTVDQDGYVLDEIVQTRRDTKGAKRLLIRRMKKQGLSPTALIRGGQARCDACCRTSIAQRLEQPRREFSYAAAKTRTDDAGLQIRRRSTTIHLRILSGQKSFRTAASETLSPGHPHSLRPSNGAVEGLDRHSDMRSNESASCSRKLWKQFLRRRRRGKHAGGRGKALMPGADISEVACWSPRRVWQNDSERVRDINTKDYARQREGQRVQGPYARRTAHGAQHLVI
jgi:putative transposase